MRKIKVLFSITALLAVSLLCTSCWRADNNSHRTETTELVIPTTYELTVTSNVEAKIEVGGQTAKTGTIATFSDLTAKSVKVTVTATDATYSVPANKQEITVEFSDEKTTAVVDFTFAKESEVQVPQAVAKGSVVTNDAANASDFGKVEISVPANVTITGNTTDPFSVVAFKSTEDIVEKETTEGTYMEIPTITLKCEPDGAQFSPELPIKAYIGAEAAGMEIIVDGKGHIIDDEGYVNVEAKHFSLSKLPMGSTAKVVAVLHYPTTINKYISTGNNTIQYKEKSGFEVLNAKPTGIVLSVLKSVYGSPVKETVKTAKYTSNASGEGTYNFKQPYTDHKFTSGKRTFEVRVYQPMTVSVTAPVHIEPVHSGGAGQ